MTLRITALDTVQRGDSATITGNVVTPAPNALIVAAVVGYDHAFLADTTPILEAGWLSSSTGLGVLAGGQTFFSWQHFVLVWLMWGTASATPTPDTWRVSDYHGAGVAGIWQVPNGKVAADSGRASDTIPGFLGPSGGPTADHLTLNLSRTPKTSSLVVAVNGSAGLGSSWDIVDPAGYTNLFSEDSNLYSPADEDYPTFTHTHLDVSVARGPSDTLTWDVTDGATVGGVALEIVEKIPPRLRQFPRDDALGNAPRPGRESSSVQATTRQGWSGTYR